MNAAKGKIEAFKRPMRPEKIVKYMYISDSCIEPLGPNSRVPAFEWSKKHLEAPRVVAFDNWGVDRLIPKHLDASLYCC